ncbi:MAG TPA: RDD family protein [Burkholderiaceae bacterium]
MSGAMEQNRFAPPRADVEDSVEAEAGLVEAGRGERFLAALIDGLVPTVAIIAIAVAIAIPAYETYKQSHTPGIEPPPLGSGHHLTTTWAWLGGFVLLGYFIYSAVLVYLYGQTFGKRVMGIRVVHMDGGRVAFSRFIFLRWLPVAVMGCIPFVGWVITSLVDPLLIFRDSRRCLHDDIASTRVVTAASSADATLRGDPKYAGANLRTFSF